MTTNLKAGPGRPPGARNKVSAQLREMIADFCEANFDKVKEDFETLAPKDRIKLYTELLPYVVSRLTSSENTINFDRMSEEDINDIINKLLGNES